MQDQLSHLAAQLTDDHAPEIKLNAAILGLEIAERAAHALAELGPEDANAAYLAACDEAGLAMNHLMEVDTLFAPEQNYLAEGGNPTKLAQAVAGLAEEIAEILVSAAEHTKECTDRAAYLSAAGHACRLAKALG